ncbi:hypothetical protein ACWY4P_12675 [Streptomyces sp. LZ34]
MREQAATVLARGGVLVLAGLTPKPLTITDSTRFSFLRNQGKRMTTLVLMVLFVMLNFTTCGGIFEPELQNGFFGALHSFWNGPDFVEGARSLLYFDSAGLGGRMLSLVLWLVAGLLLVAAAAVTERRSTTVRASIPSAEADAEEEMGEAVAV